MGIGIAESSIRRRDKVKARRRRRHNNAVADYSCREIVICAADVVCPTELASELARTARQRSAGIDLHR